MKKLTIFVFLAVCILFTSFAQVKPVSINGVEVAKNKDVVFHQIDEHTWVGTGHIIYNESLYLLEGNDKALLIDAGAEIKDLDVIVKSITKKPVMLVATHVHSDHTGSAIKYFPEIYINPNDSFMLKRSTNYKGDVKFLKDGEIIDLGGRTIEVVFTPGHTPGSTSFIDKKAGYGFSGDSFGSGNLLLSLDFSTLIATCEKMSNIMNKYGIVFLYPGHYAGDNPEMKQRVDDMITLSKDVLSGKVKGDPNPEGMMGLNLIVNQYGVRINYTEKALK